MFELRLDGEVELARKERAFQTEKKTGTTNMERESLDGQVAYMQDRGQGRVPGPCFCKASYALGSLDFIFKARRFWGVEEKGRWAGRGRETISQWTRLLSSSPSNPRTCPSQERGRAVIVEMVRSIKAPWGDLSQFSSLHPLTLENHLPQEWKT